MEQEYWSSPENRYYQLRELVTQLDFKAIREDRLAEATRIAREKAWAEGEAKGRTDAARSLLRMGLELSRISEATGLSLEEIEALSRN